jgi:GT2 family glycosyltransferase
VFKPIKVIDIELSHPIPTLEGLEGYEKLQVLIRLHGTSLGYLHFPLPEGRCTSTALSQAILEQYSWSIISHLIKDGFAAVPQPEKLKIEDLVKFPHPVDDHGSFPLVTLAVCTRDRPEDLAICLNALTQLDYPHLDLLVIDNAPSSDATERLIRENYPQVCYVCEPRPGLSWARNRTIVEAKGEIIAWTDDDVIVDPGWVKALVKNFAEDPAVMAVTGLVVPYELETESQYLFERHGGFGRGFERKSWRVGGQKMPWQMLGAGQYGTGANMSFRRSVFEHIGGFDPALGAGTVTNGCEDLEIFFRVLKAGYGLVYDPSVLVRHRHRRNYTQLRSQLTNDGIGLYAYFIRGAIADPDYRWAYLRLALWWFVYGNLRRLWISLKHPTRFPRDLVLAELGGCFTGLTRYQKACKIAAEIENRCGSLPLPAATEPPVSPVPKRQGAVAIRTVDISQPLQALTDIKEYKDIRLFVTWKHRSLGSMDFANSGEEVSINRLREVIVNGLGTKVLEPDSGLKQNFIWAETVSTLTKHYSSREDKVSPEQLAANIPVSIIVATYDRPDDLRNCLDCLVAQESPRRVEIIVVDNHPESGLTAPIVAEFPHVVLVNEPRKGLAYARNAGFAVSTGDICVTTDDDVTMPTDWLEKLVVPFTRSDVMAVTGNILPLQLETKSQQLFESYGGLGRGFKHFEVNGDWLESFPRKPVPTWELGATANAAFRSNIFTHPEIGLMDETLGAGMPSGVGEDTYLFYKVLKAGYTLVYQAKAYVWHKHRSDMAALRHQIYHYSKGHVAYHLTTWLSDRDWRGWWQIFVVLPLYHAYRIKERLLRRSNYPIPMVLLEIVGNLVGPWSWWQSHLRVKREGRSTAYVPVSQRQRATPKPTLEETPQYATVTDSQPATERV